MRKEERELKLRLEDEERQRNEAEEQLKKDLVERDAENNKNKQTILQLKKVGRSFREKYEAAEKNLVEMTEGKKNAWSLLKS